MAYDQQVIKWEQQQQRMKVTLTQTWTHTSTPIITIFWENEIFESNCRGHVHVQQTCFKSDVSRVCYIDNKYEWNNLKITIWN